MFIPYNMCQKVSQSAVSKPSHDPHDTQTDAHAAPMLRFQMRSGFSLWWNPSPSEGSSSSGLLISGLFIPLSFSMGECDISSTSWFWHTNMWACVHAGTEEQPKLKFRTTVSNRVNKNVEDLRAIKTIKIIARKKQRKLFNPRRAGAVDVHLQKDN